MIKSIYNKKRGICAILIFAVVLAVCFYGVNSSSFALSPIPKEKDSVSGKVSSSKDNGKDEVVYANLTANGSLENVYVVNVLDVDKSGNAVDYGDYKEVVNLTDATKLINEDGKVTVNSTEGKFYYEGYGEKNELPWLIDIDYTLDGMNISPANLADQSGDLNIKIKTRKSQDAAPVFYDNYMLQISVPMDMSVAEDIDSGGGTEALSGGTKLVNYTVLPGNDGDFKLSAKVQKFHMERIQVSAIPFSMDFDTDELDDMTDQFDALSGAVSELNSGTGALSDGLSKSDDGFETLYKGSKKLNKGLTKLNKGTKTITKSSITIANSLSDMSKGLNDKIKLEDIEKMLAGLSGISSGLKQMSGGMTQMLNHMDAVLAAVPSYPATEIQNLENSGDPDSEAVAEYATKAGNFITLYKQYSGSLKDTSSSVSAISVSVAQITSGLSDLKSLGELQAGLGKLATQYKKFNSGLQTYCGGVSSLANSYKQINGGISKSSKGISQIADGASELHRGTGLLSASVNKIPDQIQEKIDSITGGSNDFEPVSFVSKKNKNVNSVQFVLSTEKIKKPKVVKEEKDDGKGKETLIDRVLGLFK